MLQSVEFGCAMLLLNYTSKAQFRFSNIFKDQLVSRRRSWLKATIVGLGSLFFIILLTSFLTDILLGRKVSESYFHVRGQEGTMMLYFIFFHYVLAGCK